MKKEVLITIKGTQLQDGEKDEVELFTTGNYYRRGNSYFIAYDESEATGFQGSRTIVKVEDGLKRVTLNRTGTTKSQLIVERGVRHQCNYDTGYGNFTIGVLGDRICSTLNENGGELEFGYSLDINASLASENTVAISIRQPEC